MIFMVLMHGLQLVLLKSTQPKDQPISGLQQFKIFVFGVFELLAWQKKQPQLPKNNIVTQCYIPKLLQDAGRQQLSKHPGA